MKVLAENLAIKTKYADLLKEVGEPVAFLHQWIEYHPYGDTVAGEPCSAITNDGKPFDKSDTVTPLFTSDQVAAAVLKATKPLEERRCEIRGYAEHHREHTSCLRTQLAAAQEDNQKLRIAWQPIETAPKETEIFIGRFIDGKFRFGRSELFYEHANEFEGETWSGWLWSIDNCNESIADCPTHWMPLPKAPNDASS